MNIADLIHPEYAECISDWRKWRLTYKGGEAFITRYLRQISKREERQDFFDRRWVTYCPSFAKAAVNDIKNSIYQRLVDITREGGSSSYQAAIRGQIGGVDLLGSSMSTFIGREVLPELLPMTKVGVYVDAPPVLGPTIADKGDLHPYLYVYKTEDFRSWAKDTRANRNEFSSILLRDINYEYDEATGLPTSNTVQYRRMWIGEDGFVHVKYYDDKSNLILYPLGTDTADGEIILGIRRIPFVIFELTDSLLADAANIQIALLNMRSNDISYAIKSNFPFYTEQFDPRLQSSFIQQDFDNTYVVNQSEEVQVGLSAGRRYTINTERPGFIHPSPEPLRASMDLADSLKAEIRQIVNLAVTNLQPKMASAESKQMDNGSLEAGLSYIGLELEHGERKIADFWAMYENAKTATVIYPENYSLISQADRHDKVKALQELMPSIPSITYQKEIAKQIVNILLRPEISIEKLQRVISEIEAAPVVISDPNIIALDIQNGLVGNALASQIRGYPAGEVEQATADHTSRLVRIAAAQSPGGINGIADVNINPLAAKQEKAASRDSTLMTVPHDATRGEGMNGSKS